jgi:DMSO/TMAO reductase YedYZ heme-binding membrane subunit
LGTYSLDLLAVVVISSLLRGRMGHRSWRAVHVLSWVAWAAAVAHAAGIGTDLAHPSGLAILPTVVCVTAVLLAIVARGSRSTA